MSSKSEEDIIIIVVLLLERKKDPDRERETARSDVQSVFTFTFNKASVFSIKRDDEIAFHPSSLPSFFFAKLGLDTLSTSVRVFFSPFFLSFKSFGVFGGWSLTALLKRHKARARESPREREKGVFEEEEEEKEVK